MSRPQHTSDQAGWANFVAQHGVGDVVNGEVVGVVPFGAYIHVGDGVHGFAPGTEWPTLPVTGDRVSARILAIDPENHRFSVEPA